MCRESGAKRGLTRIVRTPEGKVEIDPTGRQNGRGAYLCEKQACWQRAATSNALSRALNVPLTDEAVASLTEFALGLATSEDTAVDSKDSNA
ncbi:MAG TPA: YlxR family protein [Thermomicrobiales bacterium]|nr:YlxR family protein [Thermomicrobiales bacterium]